MATDGIGGFSVEPPVGLDECTILKVVYPDIPTIAGLVECLKSL